MKKKEMIGRLTSTGALFRCQGIIAAAQERNTDPEVIEAISALRNDKVLVLGRRVYSYAYAALDFLGIEKYSGEDEDVPDLILFFEECSKNPFHFGKK
ncbi:MAG: hypothetical protein II000_03645 [Clostridia bacterium]|nr:hypothetical protein [Clostridia bacterium]